MFTKIDSGGRNNQSVKVVEYSYDSRKVSHFLGHQDPLKVLAEELGQPFLDYRMRWDLARTFKKIPDFPLHVDYELKFSCNLRCPICLLSLPEREKAFFGQAKKSLAVDLVKGLIDEGSQSGQAAMGFGGLWEPLLSPHLASLVAYGRERGLVEAMFNTNGVFLTEERSRELIEAGLTRLMISVDAATESTYNLMRPGSNFELLKENILSFLALRKKMGRKLPILRLSFCLSSLNEHELMDFLEFWQGRADFFSLQYFGNYKDQSGEFAPLRAPVLPPSGLCAQPMKRLLVRHNGSVLPCCDVSGLDLAVGNIEEESLSEIWRGVRIKKLRNSVSRGENLDPICIKCQTKYERKLQD